MMLARYGAAVELAAQPRSEPERQQLRDLMERRDQLVEMRKSERIRLTQSLADWITDSLHQLIEALDSAMRDNSKPPKRVVIAIARRLLVALNVAIRDKKSMQT